MALFVKRLFLITKSATANVLMCTQAVVLFCIRKEVEALAAAGTVNKYVI
jgi:hypothetical protein